MATYFMVLVLKFLQKLPKSIKWLACFIFLDVPTVQPVHPENSHPVIRGPIQSLKTKGATVQPSYDLFATQKYKD
jgi:hypothetical protein